MHEQDSQKDRSTVRYGTDDFRNAVETMGAAVMDGGHACVLFAGGGAEDQQAAVGALADYTTLDLYQRDANELIGQRPEQTQGNLREAFDNASDVPTILLFKNADAFFRASEDQKRQDDLDDDARTVMDYLSDRISHKPGVTVLHVTDPKFIERARQSIADVTVQF